MWKIIQQSIAWFPCIIFTWFYDMLYMVGQINWWWVLVDGVIMNSVHNLTMIVMLYWGIKLIADIYTLILLLKSATYQPYICNMLVTLYITAVTSSHTQVAIKKIFENLITLYVSLILHMYILHMYSSICVHSFSHSCTSLYIHKEAWLNVCVITLSWNCRSECILF